MEDTCEVCEDDDAETHFTVAFIHQEKNEVIIQDMCETCAQYATYQSSGKAVILYQEQ